MVPSARKAVTGDGVCIGLTFKTSPFLHPKTQRNRELIEAIVEEVRSHKELRDVCFTSIQINHNTISAPHTDNNLIGTPSIAMGLGSYVGGRLRLEGAKQPLHIRDHAVVFNGRNIHFREPSTGTAGRWCCSSTLLGSTLPQRCRHNSEGWAFDCHPAGLPPSRSPPLLWIRSNLVLLGAGEVSEGDVDEVLDPKPKKTLEEAESREHRMTHLPKNPHCEVCSKAIIQRTPKRRKSSKPSAAEEAKPQPTKFGEQVTGNHFIKGGREDERDPHFPCDTVAVVLYDRGTRFLAVYPQVGQRHRQHRRGHVALRWPTRQGAEFLLRQRARVDLRGDVVEMAFGNRHHGHAAD